MSEKHEPAGPRPITPEEDPTRRERLNVHLFSATPAKDHPNVVAVYDAGELETGRIFIAMEMVEGQTLKEWVRAPGRSWSEVLKAYVEAGKGLAAAHTAGLVHRDFKPENVQQAGRDGRAP
jgi:serine/threonine protein kinase